jgi:hypothetical protein
MVDGEPDDFLYRVTRSSMVTGLNNKPGKSRLGYAE